MRIATTATPRPSFDFRSLSARGALELLYSPLVIDKARHRKVRLVDFRDGVELQTAQVSLNI
jgi:hypothetical protein